MSRANDPKFHMSFLLEHRHPLATVWKSVVAGPSIHAPETILFVSAKNREDARARSLAGMALLEGKSIDPIRHDSLRSFAELVEWYDYAPEVGARVTSALFASGTAGRLPYYAPDTDRPVFLVPGPLSVTLADHWMQCGPQPSESGLSYPRHSVRPGILAPARLSRAKAASSGVRLPDRVSDVDVLWDSDELLPELLGKPDASLGDAKGPHWAVRFEDDVIVHIYNWRPPKYRTRGQYDMASNDVRGFGRVSCWLGDAEVAKCARALATSIPPTAAA